jgi:hypothetical protein
LKNVVCYLSSGRYKGRVPLEGVRYLSSGQGYFDNFIVAKSKSPISNSATTISHHFIIFNPAMTF